jgi:hypothetical protein
VVVCASPQPARLTLGRAGDEAKQTTPAGPRIPIPKREDFERMLRKIASKSGLAEIVAS